MGNNIKINDEIYGTSIASEVTYDGGVSGLEATNTQAAIDELANNVEECFQSVSNGKSLVASAITDMGVETASDATFETMANNIGNIETGINTCNCSNINKRLYCLG